MKQMSLIILFACLCHGVSKATECTGRGRFPNDDVEECRGYTMCLLGGANGFTQYKLTCPLGFVYSHLEQQCTNATNYQCLPSFVCNKTGSFINDLGHNCSSFIACPAGLTNVVTARLVECPLNHVFNPSDAICVNSTEYKCSVGVEQTKVPESLTEVPPASPSTKDFNIQVTSESGFQISSNVSVNSAVGICVEWFVLFAAVIFVNCN